ncbi:transcriptional regulator swi6 [Dispira simplex]|nr:transcriptional regulator swi6 [Dispira simplex]
MVVATHCPPFNSEEMLFAFYYVVLANDHRELLQLLSHETCQRMINSPIIRDPSGGFNALMFAVTLGHTECVRVLINNGADVNFRIDGATPIFWALRNADGLRQLLEDSRVDVHAVDNAGKTALQRAREKRLTKAVHILNKEIQRRRDNPSYQEMRAPVTSSLERQTV